MAISQNVFLTRTYSVSVPLDNAANSEAKSLCKLEVYFSHALLCSCEAWAKNLPTFLADGSIPLASR